MFNHELKRRFIEIRNNEATLPKGYLELQFRKVAVMEHKLQKDVSNFSFYDITEYYKTLNASSVNGLKVLNSQFSIYTDWCLKQNLVTDGQNHFLELRTEDYNNCINKALVKLSIFSREELLDLIYELPNPKDRFLILALFEGIKGKDFSDITLLKPEDINGNICTLASGKQIEISDDLKDIIIATIAEDTYYSMSGHMQKKIPLIDHGYIIKEYPNVEVNAGTVYQSGRRLYSSLQRAFEFLGVPHLKANDLYYSGIIHTIKTNAKVRSMKSIDYIYSEYFEEMQDKYNIGKYKKAIVEKYEDYL